MTQFRVNDDVIDGQPHCKTPHTAVLRTINRPKVPSSEFKLPILVSFNKLRISFYTRFFVHLAETTFTEKHEMGWANARCPEKRHTTVECSHLWLCTYRGCQTVFHAVIVPSRVRGCDCMHSFCVHAQDAREATNTAIFHPYLILINLYRD